MKITHPTYVTLVLATHREGDDLCEPELIVGFGMLKIEKRGPDDWRFAIRAEVADTIGEEALLLTELADVLPMPEFLIGAHIEAQIITPLLRAADRMTPVVAAYVRQRVARLQSALPVDVAQGTGRRAPPLPYADPIIQCAPITVAIADDQIVNPKRTRTQLEAEAVDVWLRFLRGTALPQVGTAGIATATWIASRQWRQ